MGGAEAGGVIVIGWLELALATGFIVLTGGVALALKLGVTKSLWIATARTYLQLLTLGLVLGWVFRALTKVMTVLTPWNQWAILAVSVAVTVLYTISGGLCAVIMTDFVQYVIIMIGAVALAWYGVVHVGDRPPPRFLEQKGDGQGRRRLDPQVLPPEHAHGLLDREIVQRGDQPAALAHCGQRLAVSRGPRAEDPFREAPTGVLPLRRGRCAGGEGIGERRAARGLQSDQPRPGSCHGPCRTRCRRLRLFLRRGYATAPDHRRRPRCAGERSGLVGHSDRGTGGGGASWRSSADRSAYAGQIDHRRDRTDP